MKPLFSAFRLLPLADGGDGTLDVLLAALGGRRRRTRVTGPLGRPVVAEWGIVRGDTAVIEMARASGIALTRGRNRVMEATSRGTGELIRAAMDAGCRSIYLGVGGTATADGGAGALAALGLRYFDRDGRALAEDPVSLLRLHRVDRGGLDPRLERTRLFILCDVRNPLLGPRGSARTFGPQKGASPRQVRTLEKFLKHWSRFARRQTRTRRGAGAAGAVAYGLSAFAGANLVEGCPFIMKAVGWSRAARSADVIVTGEGRLDPTSFSGKVAGEVARGRGRAIAAAVCGTSSMTAAEAARRGLSEVVTLGAAGFKRPVFAARQAARRLAKKLKNKI